MSQAYTLQTHQALRVGCPAVFTPEEYTHHPRCPHLMRTLQWVVDEVLLPMRMTGRCSGTTPVLARALPHGYRCLPPSTVTSAQVVVPPTINEAVYALGYHHLGNLYAAHHWVDGQRALGKGHLERAPTRKAILGLRAWLARHSAVLVPLLWPHTAVAGRCRGVDPEHCTGVPRRGGHQGQVGQNHHNGDHVPLGVCGQGHYSHEGCHGGRKRGIGARGVLPAPGCGAD